MLMFFLDKIISSLKQSFQIKDKKLLFLLLFIIQTAFLGIIIYAFMHYFTLFLNFLNFAVQSLDNISSSSIFQQNFLLDASMKSASNILLKGIGVLYAAYVLLNGLNWDFTNMFVNKKLSFPFYEIHFAVLAFIFLFPAMVIIKIIVNSLIKLGLPEPMQILFYLVLIITWYFMMISFALINKYDLSQIKEHLKETFKIGYRKAEILVPTYIIILLVLSAFITLFYFLQELPYLSVTLLSIILFIIAAVWTRIYFLTTMKNL